MDYVSEQALDPRWRPVEHGYAPGGQRAQRFAPPLSVAISRQTGARGTTIARQVAEQLGWPFYDQEALQFLINPASGSLPEDDALSSAAESWVEEQLFTLRATGVVAENSDLWPLTRAILALAARGECVLVGRGAGLVLPESTRLFVRLVAPTADRVAFLCQTQRLSVDQAEALVARRDESRRAFLDRSFGVAPEEPLVYDLTLNVATLGVDASAAIIAAAAREKAAHVQFQRTFQPETGFTENAS